jgi:hypothetical protein
MSLVIALMLATSSPAFADLAPRCGFGNRTSPSDPGSEYSDCDTGDTASDCDDTGVEAQSERADSGRLPAPVVASLMASVLIVGIGALRRREES